MIFMLLLSPADFFLKKITFFKKNSFEKLSVSNSLDPDQDSILVGSDLCLNCLQRVSVDDKSYH